MYVAWEEPRRETVLPALARTDGMIDGGVMTYHMREL